LAAEENPEWGVLHVNELGFLRGLLSDQLHDQPVWKHLGGLRRLRASFYELELNLILRIVSTDLGFVCWRVPWGGGYRSDSA